MHAPNAQQLAVVAADGHVLATACPGAGKTGTLTLRAERLLRTYPDQTVVACTFTKDAATELSERIRKRVPGAAKRLLTGTFNALAAQGLASGSAAADRTARATEQTARNTRRLVEASQRGALTFE